MMGRTRSRTFWGRLLGALGALSALALLMLPATATARETKAQPKPFGHACKAQEGVRFCPTVALSERVPTWDGVPIDADVTLPETGNGPWPTIAMLHGWGSKKTEFEDDGLSHYYAQHGYAVLTYSDRGWGHSCGAKNRAIPKPPAICEEGWIRMADQRYENRDTSTCSGCSPTRESSSRKGIGVPASHTAAGRASSWPT